MARKTDAELLLGWERSYAPFFERCEQEFAFLSQRGFARAERSVKLANASVVFQGPSHVVKVLIEYADEPWAVVSGPTPVTYGVVELIRLLEPEFEGEDLAAHASFLERYADEVFADETDLWDQLKLARASRTN